MDINLKIFYRKAKEGLFNPKLETNEIEGCDTIIKAYQASEGKSFDELAYILATVYHETGHTMLPVKEMGGAAYFYRLYDIRGNNPRLAIRLGNNTAGDGVKYAGRGYVQITGKSNYKKFSDILGIDLINTPDHALDREIATKILIYGMKNGTFTGKKLSDYFDDDKVSDFVSARRIINGTDKAALIASYAAKFKSYLIN